MKAHLDFLYHFLDAALAKQCLEIEIQIKSYFRAVNLVQLKLDKGECLYSAWKIYLPVGHFIVQDIHLW